MDRIADFLLEACFLKQIPRSGYQFLRAGQESVAEHVYTTTFIALVMSRLQPEADAQRLLSMCLVHDLPEARTGDLNHVQQIYLERDESRALRDALGDLSFGEEFIGLIDEFNAGETLVARLARDADQLALIVDLKNLDDVGYRTPQTWLSDVRNRLQTEVGRTIAQAVLSARGDGWWRKIFC
jgi:5'-deoxynucleotidase YfbR-like HD superfamily hydrolase